MTKKLLQALKKKLTFDVIIDIKREVLYIETMIRLSITRRNNLRNITNISMGGYIHNKYDTFREISAMKNLIENIKYSLSEEWILDEFQGYKEKIHSYDYKSKITQCDRYNRDCTIESVMEIVQNFQDAIDLSQEAHDNISEHFTKYLGLDKTPPKDILYVNHVDEWYVIDVSDVDNLTSTRYGYDEDYNVWTSTGRLDVHDDTFRQEFGELFPDEFI